MYKKLIKLQFLLTKAEGKMNRPLPKHIAIIMDGNGRWAKKRLLSKKMGHRAGADALKKIVEKLENTEIKDITVYAFSTENWRRSEEEVNSLMELLREYIKNYIKDNDKNNVKIDTIGDLSILEQNLRNDIMHLKNISSEKTGVRLHIALNYGGRDEIVRAVKNIYKEIEKGNFSYSDIDEKLFSDFLDTKEYGDPELIIRPGGEYRLSNFLSWQSAYSELYFTEKLWPDFKYEDLQKALDFYQKRERRFGGRVED